MQKSKTFRNERLTYRLNIVAQEAINANDEIFLRETGCSIRELRVLRLVDDNPGITFAEISQIAGLERSLTSRLIQRLLKADLISRANSVVDARVFLLSTTKKGQNVRKVARYLSDKLEITLTDPLSSEELSILNDVLERLGTWVTSEEYRSTLKDT